MIVELRTYTTHPGKLAQCIEMYDREGREIQLRYLECMVGYYTTEIGMLNQIVHLWGYESLDDRARRRAALAADKGWQAYVAKLMPLLVGQESKILNPAPFFAPAWNGA